uniref:KilA-N domain-containing protein n=1 Tax=viral metagenome TaxID=1070528 RepID=A0A6C0C9T1_9ZZZZ
MLPIAVSVPENRCIFKKIDDRFSMGKSINVEMLFMNDNSYVNCSKISGATGKSVTSWLADEKNKDLIEEIEQGTDLLMADLVIIIDTQIYVHPALADHIIVWFGGTNIAYYTKMMREFMLFKKDNEIMDLFITKYLPKTDLGDEDLAIENNNLRAELLLFSTHKAGFTLDDLVNENNKLQSEILRLRQELLDAYGAIASLEKTRMPRTNSATRKLPPVQNAQKIARRSISPPRTAIPTRNDNFPRSKSVSISCFRKKTSSS